MPPGITGPSRWLLCSVLLSVASGTGKGPIGLYAVNARLGSFFGDEVDFVDSDGHEKKGVNY